MSQKTDAELLAQADIIRNETAAEANTKVRIAQMFSDIIDSKINNENEVEMSAENVSFAPSGTISADNVQTAIEEVSGDVSTLGTSVSALATAVNDLDNATVKSVDGPVVDNTDPQNPIVNATNIEEAITAGNGIASDQNISVNTGGALGIGAPSNPGALKFFDDGTVRLNLGSDADGDMYRRATSGNLERRSPAQVRSDIGAASASDLNNLSADLTDHINDSIDAHDSTAISVIPAGGVTADNVLQALYDLDANKQNNLGYTAENVANKATDFSTVDNTKYPTTQAVLNEIINRVAGLAWKSPVTVATTANITLSGEQTIDGFATSSSRVLVKNQSTPSQNGIYISDAGAWTRATDADTGVDLQNATVSVNEGSTNANTTWNQISDGITIGSTSIVWTQFGASVPDASSSVKGIAKLYPSTSLGANTDGAPDQNAVKTYVDAAVAGATIANASETVAGKVEEATDAEMTAGTATGGTGAKLFSTPAKLVTWWGVLKAAAQTFANLTATAFKLAGQAAASGKKNALLILDDGTIQKVAWVEFDTTNKTTTSTGVDDLEATTQEEWKNSSGVSIFKILNGLKAVFGGTAAFLEVNSGIADGSSGIIMQSSQDIAYRIKDASSFDYTAFKSSTSGYGRATIIKQKLVNNQGVGFEGVRVQYKLSLQNTTAAAAHVVGTIDIPSNHAVQVHVHNALAYATNGNLQSCNPFSALGVNAAGTTSGVTETITPQRITATTGGFSIAYNNTTDQIELTFTNETGTGRQYDVVFDVTYIDYPIPV